MRCIPAFSVYIHNCIQRHQSEPQDSLPTPRAYINLFFINIPSLSISYLTITHELI